MIGRPMGHARTRRFAAAAVASLFLVLAACGGNGGDPAAGDDTTSPTASSIDAGPWTFTDDRGIEITLEEMPTEVVAYAPAPAAALMHHGIHPTGVFGVAPLDAPTHYGDLDLGGIEVVGEIYGEINIESLAALQPDLVVTAFDPRQTDGGVDGHSLPFGFADGKQFEKIDAIAPVVAINGVDDNSAVIARFEELAVALGADVGAEQNVAARDRFDAAVVDLQAATEENPDVLATAGTAWAGDAVYVSHPSAFPDLREFQSWGLEMIEPPGQVDAGTSWTADYFWVVLSFENADRYPSDLLLWDGEGGALTRPEIAEHAALGRLPAVQADQIVDWSVLVVWSYDRYAALIENIADAVRSADPDLV